MANVHDDVAEATELGSSYRFGKETTDHFIRWAVVTRNVLTLLYVYNEEVYGVHVSYSLAA